MHTQIIISQKRNQRDEGGERNNIPVRSFDECQLILSVVWRDPEKHLQQM